MNKSLTKKILTYAGIIVLFLVISYAFVPQVLGGKIVNQSDISGYIGMSQEMNAHDAAHPSDKTAWTNSMFSGMPTTAISSPSQGDWTKPIYDALLVGKRPATYLFISLIGAFLLMLSLGINGLIAIGGAIAVTFCSYNFQIIQVGHNTKMQAIAFLPWALAAFVYTYRSALAQLKTTGGSGWSKVSQWLPKTVLGAVLFGLALSFQIKANHQQITYYLAIIIFLYAIVLLVWILAHKENRDKFGRFMAASVLLLVIGCVGIATNTNKLLPLYRYTENTMRGGSELSSAEVSPSGAATTGSKKTQGLDLSYATNWSYGWKELPNMMIPDFNGGSSAGAVNPDKSETYKLLKQSGQQNLSDTAKHLPLYWGPQPFTAGPMYMGAITVFLFILGLCLYKGKEKWWLLAATLVAIFMALGSHFMGFTKFCYNYLPLYNKFRTVSMALVVLQFTLPMLGFLVLDKIVKKEYSREDFRQAAWIAYIITGGFCLVFALMPGLAGNFTGSSDSQMQDILSRALQTDRRHLLASDSLWSFLLISASFLALLWAYGKKTVAARPAGKVNPDMNAVSKVDSRMLGVGVGIGCLVFLSMFAIGKRYLNGDNFTTPLDFSSQFTKRAVDDYILQDTTLNYRVLDLTSDVFNDAHLSYWHKNVGGYSPAKLQRYQDLIDWYISPEINGVYSVARSATSIEEIAAKKPATPILDALNTKYLILGSDFPPVENSDAKGNAWFVDSTVAAPTPDDEIALIDQYDLGKVAVVGNDFSAQREAAQKAASVSPAVSDTIFLTGYAPNELRYHYRVASDRPVIFSEIYYPDGWHAWLADSAASTPSKNASAAEKTRAAGKGTAVEVFRADWILRSAVLPAGEHNLIMRFDPSSYKVGERISKASSIMLVLLVLLSVGGMVATKKKD